jgi:ferredoxin
MIELIIDGRKIEVEPGTTLMEAAAKLGIEIPRMCHYEGLPHFPSCMVCVVKDVDSGRLLASCSVRAKHPQIIVTMDDEVRAARKTALDLLLSDHVGDCEAPCQLSCPAHMDIPRMNHLLAEGKFEEAWQVVLQDIALPAILGRICPAPCEGACRRKTVDQPVSICLLKRYAGDHRLSQPADMARPDPGVREDGPRVAVIGSGPHGLSAAWYLRSFGYAVTIFDRNPLPGGALRYSVPRKDLPLEVLDEEIGRIRDAGVEFRMDTEIGADGFSRLEEEYDAVVTPLEKAPKMAIRASALGKEAAWETRQKLEGLPATGERKRFNSRFGKLMKSEITEYLKESVGDDRLEPAGGKPAGYTAGEVKAEAARCLHCECRKPETCLLRIHADHYRADQKRFQGPERKAVVKQFQHETVVYEPQKCIKCSICVRITAKYKEELGLTFIGRGFDVEVGVPFTGSIRDGLVHTANEAANACPTGALAMKGEIK